MAAVSTVLPRSNPLRGYECTFRDFVATLIQAVLRRCALTSAFIYVARAFVVNSC